MARSINQNAYSGALPNFRNLGIALRIVVIVNVMALAAAIVQVKDMRQLMSALVEASAIVQPLLLLSLVVLVGLNDLLKRLPYALGVLAIFAIELVLTTLLYRFGEPLLDWMRDWLRGDGRRNRRGTLTVGQARLTTDGAPAYAVAEVSAEAKPATPESTAPAIVASERWLVCEGWWGGSVQAPPSWNLILWLWSRTPLLVYWHFYLIGAARGYSSNSPLLMPIACTPVVSSRPVRPSTTS